MDTLRTLSIGWVLYLYAINAAAVFLFYGASEMRLYVLKRQQRRFKDNRFGHGGRTCAVYRAPDDTVWCTDGLCTHKAIHLADGFVIDVKIERPKHSGPFDYRTEEGCACPPAWT